MEYVLLVANSWLRYHTPVLLQFYVVFITILNICAHLILGVLLESESSLKV